MANQYDIAPITYHSEPQLKALALLDRFYELAQLEQRYMDSRMQVPPWVRQQSDEVYDVLVNMIVGLPRAYDVRKRHDGK